MNIPNNTLIRTVPAAAELRKVKGFDPLKFLRKETSTESGQNVIRLDLRYKRLWFRLACPNGRMLLNPLHITDQMAIYEAMVYMSKDDAEPLARVTSTVTAQDAPNGRYIQYAQDAALNEALENAGFGIQLCDFVESTERADYGSEMTLDMHTTVQTGVIQQATETQQRDVVLRSASASASASAPAPAPAPASPAPSAQIQPPEGTSRISEEKAVVSDISETMQETHNETVPVAGASAAPGPAVTAALVAESAAEAPMAEATDATALEALPATPAQKTIKETVSDTGNSGELTPMELLMGKQSPVIPFPNSQMETAENAGAPLNDTPPMPKNTAKAAPSATYTADMTVAEIVERMTQDEAKAVVVQTGVCKGWTIAQVVERRPASLRYYLCSQTADNILKAAAQLMLGETIQQKAG